ncbi:MAG: hypothetical protein ABI045_04580 [Flavobacteriales bacterium]
MRKTHWKWVKMPPKKDKDISTHYLVRNLQKNDQYPIDTEKPGNKKTVLDYKILTILKHYYLLQIHLHTERLHQIGSQLPVINGLPDQRQT